MQYDACGRVLQKVDPNGYQSTVEYNSLGQPVSASFPATQNTAAENVSYTYGANGRVATVASNSGTTSIVYETGSDRVSSVTEPVGTMSYTYTPYGSVSTKTLPGGGTWTYTYGGTVLQKDDPNSVCEGLSNITDDQGRTVDIRLTRLGQLVSYKFDEIYTGGNLTAYCETDVIWDDVTWGNSSADMTKYQTAEMKNTWNYLSNGQWQSKVISQNDYTYDDAGNRQTNASQLRDNTDTLNTWTDSYQYDELYRLTQATYGDTQAVQNYTFDPMGNRTNLNGEQYTYNNANMLLTKGAQQYTNDANGNTLTGGGRTNTWDSENRLAQCVYNGTTSTFTYGADGLRRSSTVNGTTTQYVLDGQNVVRERRGGTNYATYFSGPTGPMYRRDDASGNVSWYVYDGLGSVVAEIGSPDQYNNPVKAARKYDVYGAVRDSAGTSTSSNKFCGSLGHASEDNTGGLIYMRARYMDPALGGFVSEDPAQQEDNWYTYCQDNPVDYVDSSGEASWSWEWAGYFIRIDPAHIADGLEHMHWGMNGKEWGALNIDGTFRHGEIKRGLTGKMRKALKKGGRNEFIGAYDSITATFESDPLFVASVLLDICGDDEDAVKLDRLDGN